MKAHYCFGAYLTRPVGQMRERIFIFVCVELCVCMYLLQRGELWPEVAGDGGHLQSQEGQGPVLSQGDGELHTSGVHPGKLEVGRRGTGWKEGTARGKSTKSNNFYLKCQVFEILKYFALFPRVSPLRREKSTFLCSSISLLGGSPRKISALMGSKC